MGVIQNKIATQANTAVEKTEKQSVATLLNAYLDRDKMRARFDDVLGKRAPQFISSIVSLVNADVNMQRVFYDAPVTIIQAALKGATFDLPIDPSLGYAYIVPFNNSKKMDDGSFKKVTEASFILGWKGMHQLALRTGAYKTINVTDVREGELRSYNRLTEEVEIAFEEDDDKREALPVVGYVGYYRLVNGAEKTIYMTTKQIENHEKKFRKGKNQGWGWANNWDAMARKTVYRQLIGKWGVMSIEYQTRPEGEALAKQMQDEMELETINSDYEVVNSDENIIGEITEDAKGEPVNE